MSDAPRSARSFKKIEKADLVRLGEIACDALTAEFKRSRNLLDLDERQIIAMCLCQGAADHYFQHESRKSCGIHDFDVWAFFSPQEIFRFGNKKPITADFGPSKFGRSPLDKKCFVGRRVDVFWRAIPDVISTDPMGPIRTYFDSSESATACELRKKSAVVVWPEMDCGDVIWNPNRYGSPASYDPWE